MARLAFIGFRGILRHCVQDFPNFVEPVRHLLTSTANLPKDHQPPTKYSLLGGSWLVITGFL